MLSNRSSQWKTWVVAFLWLVAIPFIIEGGLVFTLAYLAGTAWLLITYGLRYASQQLSCDFSIDPDRLSVGEPAKVTVTARCHGSFPVRSPELSCSFPPGFRPLSPTRVTPRLDSSGAVVAEFLFQPILRGRYRIGHCVVTLEDSVGLTRRTTAVPPCRDLVVYPRVCSVDKLGIPSRLPFGQRTYRIPVLRDLEHPATMRQYFRRTRISWWNTPADQRAPHIVVKEIPSTDSTQTMLFLDLCRKDYNDLDISLHGELAVSVAASLARHIHSTGELVGLSLLSRPGSVSSSLEEPLRRGTSRVYLPPGSEDAHLERLLEVLATVAGPERGYFGECLAYGMRSMAFATKMVVVAPTDTDDIRNYVSWAVSRGHRTVVILCGPNIQKDQAIDGVAFVHVPVDILMHPGWDVKAEEAVRQVVNA